MKTEQKIYNQLGKESGKISLPEGVFDLPWNADLVHQVMVSMRSNERDPIAHTKTRGEVRGGGKKPWRQKGTGRARHGSTRSPIWVGGGVAHGPRNDKNYTKKINKKVKTKALYTVLSKKLKDGEILFVENFDFKTPKTKQAKEILNNFSSIKGFEKISTKPRNMALITLDKKTPEVVKSFRNFGNVEISDLRSINLLNVLNHKYLIISNPESCFKSNKK